MTEPRLCPTCQHFEFTAEEPGYSSYTPGSPAHLGCALNLWSLNDLSTLADARRAMHRAEKCKHYVLWKAD